MPIFDHAKSAQAIMGECIELYCSEDTAAELNSEGGRLHMIKPLEEFEVGTFKITPFPVPHDVTDFGYLITSTVTGERLLFATDCEYIGYLFPSVTHMLIEANYSEEALAAAIKDGSTAEELKHRIRQSHMSIETTCKTIEVYNQKHTLKQVYLIHLSAHNSERESFKKRAQAASGGAEVYIAQ
jgi:phosphoribosyl 1,2-cyclic phosphodiesterase